MMFRSVLLLATLLLLTGCPDPADDTDGDVSDGGGGPVEITDLTAAESVHNVLAHTVRWETSVEAPTTLDVACGDLGDWTLDAPGSSRTQHEVFVMGLAAGAHCELTARADDASRTVSIDVGELPAYLPEVEITVPDDGAAQPGWTLLNLHNRFDGVPYTVAMIDLQGRIRWYYQASTDITGDDTPVVRLPEGVAFGGRNVRTTVVDWRGELLWQGDAGHHEVEPTGEDGHLYYLDWSRCPQLDDDLGAQIVEVDWKNDEIVWRWNFCDFYTPDPSFGDWSHANTAAPFGDDEDALIFSSRNQNSVMKVDRSSGEIIWSMGFDGRPVDGFRGDFTIDEPDRFYQQHDPEVTDAGTILMFDNGHRDRRPYSRAIELEYDYDASGESTARVIWSFRHEPDLFMPIWGDADRLPNGNTLITFGERNDTDRTTVVEVSPDEQAVWEMQMPVKWGAYRSQRVVDPPRGFVVAP